LAAAALFARDSTDIVIMKNGDRLTCQVKGLDAGGVGTSTHLSQLTVPASSSMW
jgi:hypothetical protein